MVATLDLRHDQFLLFSKFAHLYDAGVGLPEALDLVRGDLGRDLRQAVAGIIEDIYRGTSFSDGLARCSGLFSAETIGVIRAGEQRGELGTAARSVAEGLRGRVLDPARASEAGLAGVLSAAAAAAVDALHVEPDGTIQARRHGRLEPLEGLDSTGILGSLARRAQVDATGGRGVFLWEDRVVRVAMAATTTGPTAVVRVSGATGTEPTEAAAWREGPPRLMFVDGDSALRAILAVSPGKRVAVNLPVPEAVCVRSVDVALWLDPDLVAVAELEDVADAVALARSGVHAVASTRRPQELAKEMGATQAPPPVIAVS